MLPKTIRLVTGFVLVLFLLFGLTEISLQLAV
jgi:hypothetical protein